jgi:hypothetical protein
MRPIARQWAPWIALAALCATAAAWTTIRFGFAFNDYDLEASASVSRLLHGDVTGFLSLAPAYGGSLVLRSPLILLARATGGSELTAYWLLALPGLVAVGFLSAALARHARCRGWSRGASALVVALALFSTASVQALNLGHAEELLGAALAVGATLLAMQGRWLAAGLLLGLAVANKPWALVAVAPVLVALPTRPLRAGLVAAAVAATVMAPLMLTGTGATGGMTSAGAAATSAGGFSKPLSITWFLGKRIAKDALGQLPAGSREPPAWVAKISRPAIVLVAAALSALWWRRRDRAASPLGLLALALMVRCVLDPWNLPYYHLPFLLALLAWETHSARRAPFATLAVAGFLQLIEAVHGQISPDALAATYGTVALPGLVLLTLAVLAPARAQALGRPVTRWLTRLLPTLAGPELSRPSAA